MSNRENVHVTREIRKGGIGFANTTGWFHRNADGTRASSVHRTVAATLDSMDADGVLVWDEDEAATPTGTVVKLV